MGYPPSISFGPEDFSGIVYPHDDPIIITATILGVDVQRILIDTWSSIDLIFLSTYSALGLDVMQIQDMSIPLKGFSGERPTTIEVVMLPMSWGVEPLRST